jgi:hypothetical protein
MQVFSLQQFISELMETNCFGAVLLQQEVVIIDSNIAHYFKKQLLVHPISPMKILTTAFVGTRYHQHHVSDLHVRAKL